MGLVVWPMTELEADDALASAAAVLYEDARLSQVLICTPDKDLGQCVRGERVVCLDRRKGVIVDEDAVRGRFGVGPESVPDWLALVGDSADGYPGLAGWGAKTTSTVLGRYGSIEAIPDSASAWDVAALSTARAVAWPATLRADHDLALLFKKLATCVVDSDLLPSGEEALDSLAWQGPTARFAGYVRPPGCPRPGGAGQPPRGPARSVSPEAQLRLARPPPSAARGSGSGLLPWRRDWPGGASATARRAAGHPPPGGLRPGPREQPSTRRVWR